MSGRDQDREKREQDRDVLEWILGQYIRAKRRKHELDQRLMEVSAERNSPIGAINYDPLPRGSGSNEGAAGILLKMSDIEERIYSQKEIEDRTLTQIMDILDFLPSESIGREIAELRNIDGKKWEVIADTVSLSPSQCRRNYNSALNYLLEFEYIQKIVEDSRAAYNSFMFRKLSR